MGWRHIGHLGVARENRMLVGSIACRCAIGLTRLKSDDYTCRTVRKWLVDAGSIPASSTICIERKTLSHFLETPLRPSLCGVFAILARGHGSLWRPSKTPFFRIFRSLFSISSGQENAVSTSSSHINQGLTDILVPPFPLAHCLSNIGKKHKTAQQLLMVDGGC